MPSPRSGAALAALALATFGASLVASPAAAQRPTPIPPPTEPEPERETPPERVGPKCDGVATKGCPPARFVVGVALDVAQPIGEFKQYADIAAGVNFSGVVLLSPESPLGLLVNGGFISYGSDERDVTLSGGGTSIRAELGTSHRYAGFNVGPEIALRRGAVRPYVAGTVGYGNFGTRSALTRRFRDTNGDEQTEELWSRSHSSDGVLALSGLGGLRLALGSSRSPVTIDLGARYVHNGDASYVRRGDVTEDENGELQGTVTRSRADFVSYTLGVSLGFGAKQ